MSNSDNKAAYNTAGAIIGALLAAVSIFALVQGMGGQQTEQQHSRLISYDS